MADAGNFFARWSRLKQRARKPPVANEATPADAPLPTETPQTELPPLESLTADSDYTAFMRPGVAEGTRNAALQKLWRSDPVFANLDGLVEYGENYAAAFKVSAAVRTAYRVARGMMSGDAPPPKEADQPPQPKEKSPPAGATSQPESGTESASDRTAKDGSGMHEDRVSGWTGA